MELQSRTPITIFFFLSDSADIGIRPANCRRYLKSKGGNRESSFDDIVALAKDLEPSLLICAPKFPANPQTAGRNDLKAESNVPAGRCRSSRSQKQGSQVIHYLDRPTRKPVPGRFETSNMPFPPCYTNFAGPVSRNTTWRTGFYSSIRASGNLRCAAPSSR